MIHSWAPLLAVILWSGNFIVTKIAAGTIAPGVIGFYRCCVAALAMTPFLLPSLMEKKKQVRENLPKLAVLALFGTTLYQGFAYIAAQATSATNMSIITSFVPLITVGISSILLQAKPSPAVWIGGTLSTFGLFYLVSQGNFESMLSTGLNYGDGLMLGAAVAYSLYCILLQRWTLPLSLWESLYVQSIWSVVQFFPFYLMAPASTLTSQSIPLILYAGVAASVLAPYFWMRGISSLGPSRASIFMNLFPLITALSALGILNERIQMYHVIGGLMTVMGVAIAQTKSPSLFLRRLKFQRHHG